MSKILEQPQNELKKDGIGDLTFNTSPINDSTQETLAENGEKGEVVEKVNYTDEEIAAAKVIDTSDLTPEQLKKVDEFLPEINVNDKIGILNYGSGPQSKLASFSATALENVKTKDLDTVGNAISSLLSEVKGVNAVNSSDGFFTKLFKKGQAKVEDIRAKYSSVNRNIDKIVGVLDDHQVTLIKDINVLEQLLEKNEINRKELTMYILAGEKKVEALKTKELPELQAKAEKTQKPEDVQAANNLADNIDRFEKKLHDLRITRAISLQLTPQIQLVQKNNTVMADKIYSLKTNTIPLFQAEAVLALGLSDSEKALQTGNAVTKATTELLENNATKLKETTVGIAKNANESIVDIKALTKANSELIQTLEDVKRIQEEGKRERDNAKVELHRIEEEVKAKLLEVTKSVQ